MFENWDWVMFFVVPVDRVHRPDHRREFGNGLWGQRKLLFNVYGHFARSSERQRPYLGGLYDFHLWHLPSKIQECR